MNRATVPKISLLMGDCPPFVSIPHAHKDRTTLWFPTPLCERDDGTTDWGWHAELYGGLLSAFPFHTQ